MIKKTLIYLKGFEREIISRSHYSLESHYSKKQLTIKPLKSQKISSTPANLPNYPPDSISHSSTQATAQNRM